MAALAPLRANSASPTTTLAVSPTTTLAASPPTTAAGADPAPAPPSFTAFPTSYASFGNAETGFGTVGVVNGGLSVVPGAASGLPATPTVGSGIASSGSGSAASGSGTPDPPPGTGAPATGTAAGGGANAPSSTLAADLQAPSLPPQTTKVPGLPNPPPIPVATLPPQKQPTTPGLQPPQLGTSSGQQTQAQPQTQHPGATAAQNAEEAQDEQLTGSLENVSFHIAAANGTGNGAAASQLEPTAVQINGELKGQEFAGLGSTPPKPFAQPEVPPVFLNFSS